MTNKFGINQTIKGVPKIVSRSDNNFYSHVNHKGALKTRVDSKGNLVPANPNGKGSIVSHVRGGNSKESPYISTTDLAVAQFPKQYGYQKIIIKTRKLQVDIESGHVANVEVITHDELVSKFTNRLQKIRVRYHNNPTQDNLRALDRAKLDLQNILRDGEFLIKGIIPKNI